MRKSLWVLVLNGMLNAALLAQQPATPSEQPSGQVLKSGSTSSESVYNDALPLACPTSFNDSLATNGIATSAKDKATPPKPKFMPDARFSKEARYAIKKNHLKHFKTASIVSLIVDVHGNPQNLCIKQSADLGLDAQAVAAIRQYRFEPATKDGVPVPVRITVEVNFRIY